MEIALSKLYLLFINCVVRDYDNILHSHTGPTAIMLRVTIAIAFLCLVVPRDVYGYSGGSSFTLAANEAAVTTAICGTTSILPIDTAGHTEVAMAQDASSISYYFGTGTAATAVDMITEYKCGQDHTSE